MPGPPPPPSHAPPRASPGAPVDAGRLARRLLRGVLALTGAGALGVALLLAALWVEHRTALTLPTPTGPYAVGRALADWRDPATPDALAPVPGVPRELLVWVWYPAAPPARLSTGGALYAPYVPAPTRAAVTRHLGVLLGTFLTRDLARVRAHSLQDAPVASQRPAYPVVVLRGGASAAVWTYTTLAEDWASHGYVVVGFDAPYRTVVVAAPDGRVVERTPDNDPERAIGAPDSARRIDRILDAWTADVGFVLDRLQRLHAGDSAGRFTGRLDLGHVGVVGHSLGGATALQVCHDDPRCTAAVDIDGAPLGTALRDGVPRPTLFLLGGHGDASDPETRQVTADIRAIYDRLPPAARGLVTIPGANHFLFSDDGALLKSQLLQRALRAAGVLGLDGRRQLALTADCVRRFLDAQLAGGRDAAACAAR